MVVGCMEVIGDTILKPYTPPPPSPPHHPLHNTRVQLTIFDRAAFAFHVPTLYVFHPPMPPNDAIKDGLSKALFHYPHLAGRFSADERCRPCLLLNDAGVRLIETRVHTSLEEHLPLDPSSGELSRFHPPVEGGEELLRVQLNRFACGGAVVGLTSHHQVADGQSMSFFFLAWGRLVRGLAVDPLPYHDRAAVCVPRNPPTCEFDHRAVEFPEEYSHLKEVPAAGGGGAEPPIQNLVVHFSAEFMSKLKAKFVSPGRRYSTFQCLLTHLWKKVTAAREVPAEEVTLVRVGVNGRPRMRVAAEYFGNVVLWAYPRLTVGELLRGSYAEVADAIHAAVSAVDESYFRSFVDFGAGEEAAKLEVTTPEMEKTWLSLSPHLHVDSWLSFPFQEVDLGGGPPRAFLPGNHPVEGFMIFVPSAGERKGGVDVSMGLLREHVGVFKQISHCF